MQTIEIDFDVFKKLTQKRRSEKMTYNDVLREILGLSEKTRAQATEHPQYWGCRGGHILIGTRLRASYQGKTHEAAVTKRGIEYAEKRYGSPSEAAHAVTLTNVNGWRFWQAMTPGATKWVELSRLR